MRLIIIILILSFSSCNKVYYNKLNALGLEKSFHLKKMQDKLNGSNKFIDISIFNKIPNNRYNKVNGIIYNYKNYFPYSFDMKVDSNEIVTYKNWDVDSFESLPENYNYFEFIFRTVLSGNAILLKDISKKNRYKFIHGNNTSTAIINLDSLTINQYDFEEFPVINNKPVETDDEFELWEYRFLQKKN